MIDREYYETYVPSSDPPPSFVVKLGMVLLDVTMAHYATINRANNKESNAAPT